MLGHEIAGTGASRVVRKITYPVWTRSARARSATLGHDRMQEMPPLVVATLERFLS